MLKGFDYRKLIHCFLHKDRYGLTTVHQIDTVLKHLTACKQVEHANSNHSWENPVNAERAARNGYEKTCDYLDILNKGIYIQQRALASFVPYTPEGILYYG